MHVCRVEKFCRGSQLERNAKSVSVTVKAAPGPPEFGLALTPGEA
jgi:hypothetical protein